MPNENVLIDVYRDGDLIQIPLKIGSNQNADGNEGGCHWRIFWDKSLSFSNLFPRVFTKHIT